MNTSVKLVIKYLSVFCALCVLCIVINGCSNVKQEKAKLLQTIEDYENAWASGDFKKVETFFAPNAQRLHSEPHVWNRAEIKRYCEERNVLSSKNPEPFVKNAWKKNRDYLEIRVEGNIAYDIFTTETFKALHIWEKQDDKSWKIRYDVGFLHDIKNDSINHSTYKP